MSQGQTKQIINKATSAVSQAQKEYSQAPGVATVNIAELKRKLTEIVDGYSKAYSKIMNEMDITGPSKNQKKKFIKQYLKENLNQNLITSCKRTKAENLDEKFSKEILQILKENFSKPFFECADTGEVPKPQGQVQSKRPQTMKQKIKRNLSSAGAFAGGLFKKKDTQPVSQKPVSGTDSSQTAVQTKQKRGKSYYQKAKQMSGKVSQKVSSGLSKMGSMIPKREVCNEQEALMLIRLLQANTKNQLANFKFKYGEKKIALQGLQKKIDSPDSKAQIIEMYKTIKTAIQAKQQQKKQV